MISKHLCLPDQVTTYPRTYLGRNPLAIQWSELSTEMLTVSKRRTVGLNEIIEGIQRGL